MLLGLEWFDWMSALGVGLLFVLLIIVIYAALAGYTRDE